LLFSCLPALGIGPSCPGYSALSWPRSDFCPPQLPRCFIFLQTIRISNWLLFSKLQLLTKSSVTQSSKSHASLSYSLPIKSIRRLLSTSHYSNLSTNKNPIAILYCPRVWHKTPFGTRIYSISPNLNPPSLLHNLQAHQIPYLICYAAILEEHRTRPYHNRFLGSGTRQWEINHLNLEVRLQKAAHHKQRCLEPTSNPTLHSVKQTRKNLSGHSEG